MILMHSCWGMWSTQQKKINVRTLGDIHHKPFSVYVFPPYCAGEWVLVRLLLSHLNLEFNMSSATRKLFVFSIIVILLSTAISSCSVQDEPDNLHMMAMDQMPSEVQMAPVTVQTAYQFNAANPDIMKNIPCYCGCGNIGHTSNYDCYVSNVGGSGAITFDNHALGCSICVDITQDVMRMLQDEKSSQDARAYVDATYAKYGPSNIP